MSHSGENTRDNIRQRDTAQQARESRLETDADRLSVARVNKSEPLSFISELEVSPSYIRGNTSERTVTPPLFRRYALPRGTRIDRNVTRRRGIAAATERFDKAANTESKKETRSVGGDHIWRDVELGFGPDSGTRDVKAPVESGIPSVPEIVITEPGLPGLPKEVSTTLPTHISTGVFHPSRQTFFSSWHGPSISPTRELSEEGATRKVGWDYSLDNFPPLKPRSRQSPATCETKTPTSDSLFTAGKVPAATQTVDSQGSEAEAPTSDSSAKLPKFVQGLRPPLPLDSPEREDSPPPLPTRSPPRLSSISSLEGTVEYYFGEDEGNQPVQHSESDDVGDLRQLLERLNIDKDKPEPDVHEELIKNTLSDSQKVEDLIQEISNCHQAKSQLEAPEESSETYPKKVGLSQSKPGVQQLSYTEQVLLAKLRETNQKLCRVTNLWKESKQHIAYLEQELKKTSTDLQQRTEHFEAVSKGNLENFYQRERELKSENLDLLNQINQLKADKDRIREEGKQLRIDLTKDLNRKLAKVADVESKDIQSLQDIIKELDQRLVTLDLSKQELSAELRECLKTEVRLREQLLTETEQKEQAQQELEDLLHEVEEKERERELIQIQSEGKGDLAVQSQVKVESRGGTRQRLSSTVDPQADLHSHLAGVENISPILHGSKALKKVGFADKSDDIISQFGLGLGETVLTEIYPGTKVEAEKPLEEVKSQTTSRLEPFQEFHVPGRVEHWDVYRPTTTKISTCDSSEGGPEVVSKRASGTSVSITERSKKTLSEIHANDLEELHQAKSDEQALDLSPVLGKAESRSNMSKFDLLTKLSKPQPFSGKEWESGREWLRRFDSYCIAGGYNPHEIPPGSDIDGQFRAGMISLLQGAAAVWLDSLPQEERESYRKLRKAFEERWVLPYLTGTRLAEETKLANRVQGPQETAESLYQDLAHMCHKMGKGEQDLMIHFVKSLRPEIQDRVVTGCPKDMMTALQMASSAEARIGGIQFAPSLTAMLEQNPHLAAIQKQVKDLQVSQDQWKQERSKTACTYCQKTGHSQADCRQYKKDREQESQDAVQQAVQQAAQQAAKEVARQSNQQTGQQGAQGSNQQKSKPRQNRKPVRCFNCNEVGHVNRNCPQPRKPNPNRQQDSVIEDLKKRIAELESQKNKEQDPK